MTDLLEVGSYWVHRETLIVVRVHDMDDGCVQTYGELDQDIVWNIAAWHSCWLPNEPVSLEMLERAGFVANEHGESSFYWRTTAYKADRWLRWEPKEDCSFYLDCGNGEVTPLAPIKDTADLLRTMRVFGIEVTL